MNWFNQWKVMLQRRMNFLGLAWSFERYAIYLLVLAGVGAFLGFRYFHNPLAAFPLGIALASSLHGYINYSVLRKQALLGKQLILLIQVFLSEFRSVPNTVSALNSVLPKIEEPLRTEIDRLIREMNSGIDCEEALFSFAGRIGSPWAYRFAHIINLRINKGTNIGVMLLNLYMDMKTKLIKEKERGMESIGVKLESYALYAFIPLMYYMATKINPQTHYVLTHTAEGRKVILALTVLLLVGLVATIRLGNNRIR